MEMSSVTVRVDEQTKEAAARIAEDFGFDLSSVTRAFYRQMAREQRIPLNLSYPQPNKVSLESIGEAEALLAKGTSRFKDADELFGSLGI